MDIPKKLYLIYENNNIPEKITVNLNNEEYVIKSKGELHNVSFSDVDEETNETIKIWMNTEIENKLVTLIKPISDYIILYPCEAKFFEGDNTKFIDRKIVDPALSHICARKTTSQFLKNDKNYYFCRWHCQHIFCID